MLRILKETNLQLIPSPLGGDVALNNVLHGSWLTFYWLCSFSSPEKFFKIFSDFFFFSSGKWFNSEKKTFHHKKNSHFLPLRNPLAWCIFWPGSVPGSCLLVDWHFDMVTLPTDPRSEHSEQEHTEAPLLINLHTHTHTRTRTEESCEKETSRCRTGAYL